MEYAQTFLVCRKDSSVANKEGHPESSQGVCEETGSKHFRQQAILTGSWARGTQREDSDVDLIILSDDFSKMPFSERLSYLHKAWTNKIPLEAFGYTVDEFRQLRHRSIYVRDAIRNGLVLDESGSWQTKRRGVGSGRIIRPVTKSDQMKGRD